MNLHRSNQPLCIQKFLDLSRLLVTPLFHSSWARVFLAALLPCFLAAASRAGTVSGTVTNGTTGKPAAGVDIVLMQLQGAMQPVASAKTDAQGHFQIENAMIGTAPMLLNAAYGGVNYYESLPPGKVNGDLQVFDSTDKPSAFHVRAHAIIFQPSGSDLMVGEEYDIENDTQPPVAYYRADGSFLFSLPNGAQLGDVSAVGASGMPVNQNPLDKGKNQEAIAFPFRPGHSSVRLSYRVPYAGQQTKLALVSRYAEEHVAVFAQPTVRIAADGFSPAGQQQGFNVYMHGPIAANASLAVSVSGTAPVPAQNGAASGGAGGDDSQNPAVNSRAEAGGAAPVASVSTMPARLDSLKWILVAGFALLFAFGLFYLWRRPETVPVVAPGAEAAVSRHREAALPKAAAVDQAVRGSLDELKDTLLRLELRHEAGTISAEEYSRERERVQKRLRDLVKG